MNILVTNDDGINSDGIVRLASVAGKFGKVMVVAPATQCSAMSHRLTIGKNMLVRKVDFPVEGVAAYDVEGTPADCVKLAKAGVFGDIPDVVLSGINNGYNAGSDIQYSGTIGAAMEAACGGIHAIAFSEKRMDDKCMNIKEQSGENKNHQVTDKYLEKILGELIDKKLLEGEIWNVNFPGGSANECKGIAYGVRVANDAFYRDSFEKEEFGNGNMLLKLVGVYHEDAEDNTDFKALVDGYVSVGKVRNIK